MREVVLKIMPENHYLLLELHTQLTRLDGKLPLWLVDKAASHKLTMREEPI